MNAQTVTIQVAPRVAAILDTLQKRAEAQGVSLDALLLPLVPLNGGEAERPFYETATPEEWIKELYAWAESHDPNTPVILDDSREVIYEDDEP
jgi:hypothetical protein